MPVGGAMFSSLHCGSRGPSTFDPKAFVKKIIGELAHEEFLPVEKTLKGNLNLTIREHRHSHEGIKIRLEGMLTVQTHSTARDRCLPFNILDLYRNDTIIKSSGNLRRGTKVLEYTLNLLKVEGWATPFASPFGSLNYRLVALIKKDGKWEELVNKRIVLDGYHNVNSIQGSLTEVKEIDGVKSTLTLCPAALVRGESHLATINLDNLPKHTEVHGTLILLRKITYGVNVHTQIDKIWEDNQQSQTYGEGRAEIQWNLTLPENLRPTFTNKFVGVYSVKYSLKYELILRDENNKNQKMESEVDVIVGTTRDAVKCNDSSVGLGTSLSQESRRGSVQSLLSLPPSYSQLPSRSTSLYSLNLPPHYDDV